MVLKLCSGLLEQFGRGMVTGFGLSSGDRGGWGRGGGGAGEIMVLGYEPSLGLKLGQRICERKGNKVGWGRSLVSDRGMRNPPE